ncbi:MAG TPA: SDR family oxidoreductase [Pirellulales bacterium]|jgi:NAD(P)-dependent dehydrogenase (short-subunit alcohol dehydrogenase family)|nr:SDR family oxidoreductase [Pirellulales bacterium]
MEMLEGKVVLITGAGRGVGRSIAILMAAEGAKVVVNDLGGDTRGEGHDVGPGQEVVNAINSAGGHSVLNTESVADWSAAHRMVQQAIDTYGRIDAVVNNAGILRDCIFHKMSEAEWDAVINVHLKGCFNVARAAAPHFRAQSSGTYVHMTSTSGIVGNFGQVNYGAAKLGIVALSKCIALDMSRFNVRSNCIAPFAWSRLIGTIPTDKPEEAARVEKLKRMTPDKIAPLVAYLCSDASQGVTGQIFGVRLNEIFLFNQPRPIRSVHRGEGWTPATIAEHAIPALKSSFAALERSGDVFFWDPI